MDTTTRLGLKLIDAPGVDTVDNLRLSINHNANVADAQYLESTAAGRPAALTKGRLHRATDTGDVSIDNGAGQGWTLLSEPAAVILPGTLTASAALAVPAGWLACDGSAVSRSTYAALWAALSASLGAGTVTIASPGVWTLNSHGMADGDSLYLTTSGALPTGLAANTLYYVKSSTTNTFRLSASRGGSDINTTGSQSGTHTVIRAPYGIGDGSTTFTLPDLRGRVPVGVDGAAARLASPNDVAGATGGAETHTLTGAESGVNGNGTTTSNGAHTHSSSADTPTFLLASGGSGSENVDLAAGTDQDLKRATNTTTSNGAHTHALTGRPADAAHNNMQPHQIVSNWLVKT